MLSVSRTSSYAIKALSRLADAKQPWTLASELCADTGIPGPYLSKILHLLGKAGLINTKRGYRGGFALARAPSAISVIEIVEAVEGSDCLAECLLGQAVCTDDRACPTHEFWKTERERIRELLAGLTLESVAEFNRNQLAAQSSGRRSTNRVKRSSKTRNNGADVHARKASSANNKGASLGKGRD